VKRTPLSPMSPKRRSQLAERKRVVAQVMERDGGCQFYDRTLTTTEWLEGDLVGAPRYCSDILDAHEIVQRSVRPSAWLEPDLVVCLCRAHHQWIDGHEPAARRLGLLADSWQASEFKEGRRL